MKRIFNKNVYAVALLMALVGMTISSCEKDKDGNPEGKASSGPSATGFVVDSASNGTVIILQGSGLFDMRSIVFDKNNAVASFNPNFNTDKSVVFRVPDTAAGGPQNVIFTNSLGKTLSVPFKVIALPSISSSSHYSFRAGETITLNGLFLDDVSAVKITGTGTNVNIVSQTKTTITLEMPAATATAVQFDITNASGTITTTQEIINADEAFVFFRDGYENGEQDASWGDAGFVSNTEHVSGSASYGKNYQSGNWHQMGFGWNQITNTAGYQYLSFWVKGGTIPMSMWISTPTSPSGFASFDDFTQIDVPANEWKYFKLSIASLKLFATGTSFNQIGWRVKGPDGGDQKMYLDDVMFIK